MNKAVLFPTDRYRVTATEAGKQRSLAVYDTKPTVRMPRAKAETPCEKTSHLTSPVFSDIMKLPKRQRLQNSRKGILCGCFCI